MYYELYCSINKKCVDVRIKKKDLIEYLIVKKNRDRKVLFYFLEFYKREYSLNMIKWDFLNLFEGLCRICILLL